ncbi:MAG: metalloregulator ArsR/SmtB family transcription factor [Actinomycetota bacterium]
MTSRIFKDQIYEQFGRVGSALASERRLEIIDVLAQGPRHVEAIAALTDMSVANTSQHLQALKSARLVEGDRDGTRVVYRLASPAVLGLWLSLRAVAEERLADVGRIAREFAVDGSPLDEQLPREALDDATVVLDVRPTVEFASGHLPGAMSVPLEVLPQRLPELPRDRRIVVYCRGTYCHSADEAVAALRQEGFDAVRLEGGWPEWAAEGRSVATGVGAGTGA